VSYLETHNFARSILFTNSEGIEASSINLQTVGDLSSTDGERSDDRRVLVEKNTNCGVYEAYAVVPPERHEVEDVYANYLVDVISTQKLARYLNFLSLLIRRDGRFENGKQIARELAQAEQLEIRRRAVEEAAGTHEIFKRTAEGEAAEAIRRKIRVRDMEAPDRRIGRVIGKIKREAVVRGAQEGIEIERSSPNRDLG
jgi:hypothetical protein